MASKTKKIIYLHKLLPIKYEYFDCNPYIENGNNKKYSDSDDCSVRALCKVTGLSWDIVYAKLFEVAEEYKAMPDSIKVITKVAEEYGFKKVSDISCCAAAFMLSNQFGKYMIELEDHIFAYVSGTMYDSVDGRPLKKKEIEYVILQDVVAYYYYQPKIPI